MTDTVDVDIRNAINHGSVIISESSVTFRFVKDKTIKSKNLTYYTFNEIIENVYDTCSAILLGVVEFIDNNYESIVNNDSKVIAFHLTELELSLPGFVCRGLDDESINHTQLNINIETENTDRNYLLQSSIEVAMLVYNQYPNYEKYLINFHNERIVLTFVRFNKQEIEDMLRGDLAFDTCLKKSS
ncbi:hypothetical protein [Geomicrobium sp. JCM 19055]|uniref:hypothetical protein n=1 Tax=Geomicrobium sp. JCM 19055 TaxID=1460649 RepID=UPI0005A8F055|nr:hypothetical protein [Geomicrobium sp. JCM 19055]